MGFVPALLDFGEAPNNHPLHHRLQVQMVVAAGAALLALLVATILAVYKPRGMTPYGQRHLLNVKIQPVEMEQET